MAKTKVKRIVGRTGMEHMEKEFEIETGSETLDENQRYINKLLGIGDEVFFKHARGLQSTDHTEQNRAQAAIDEFHRAGDLVFLKYQNQPDRWPALDEVQRKINALMGISDETFLSVNKRKERDASIDEGQRKINEMMGISDETFKKYGK